MRRSSTVRRDRRMRQPFESSSFRHRHGLVYGHAQGLDVVSGLQRPVQRPAHCLVRVGIGDEVQTAHLAALQGDAGDVGHPQLACGGGHKPPGQVPVLAVAVVGVRRAAGFHAGKHQSVVAQDVKKAVTAGDVPTAEKVRHHQPQLVVADARILTAALPDSIDKARSRNTCGASLKAGATT